MIRIIFSITLFISFLSVRTHAQVFPIDWQRSYGGTAVEYLHYSEPTSDSGFISIGASVSNNGDLSGNHGQNDLWVVKSDKNGTIQWSRLYGGTLNEDGKFISQLPDKNYIVGGTAESANGDLTLNKGQGDCWVLKLDSTGNILWQRTYGGSGADVLNSIARAPGKGFMLAGYSNSTNGDLTNPHGSNDCWILKIDSMGNLQWQKTYGGSSYDGIFQILQNADSSYIFAGFSGSNDGDVGANYGGSDYWVAQLDTGGNILWQKNYGSAGSEFAYSVTSSDSGYVIGGASNSVGGSVLANYGQNDCWLLSIDAQGNPKWSKNYGGSGTDFCFYVTRTLDDGYVFCGYTGSNDYDVVGNHGSQDIWVVKLDSAGNKEWQRPLGGTGTESASSICQANDCGFILACYSNSTNGDVTGNHGSDDGWLVKLNGLRVVGTTTVCSGVATTFTAQGGLSYTWSPGGYTTPTVTVSLSTSTVFTLTGSSGSGVSTYTFSITVKQTPSLTSVSSISICTNNMVTLSPFGSSPPGATFAWTNNNTSIGLSGSGSGNINSFLAMDTSTTQPVVATVSVTPTLNGCVGPDSVFTITVYPCVNIAEVEGVPGMLVFPNPTSGEVMVATQARIGKLSIYNSIGAVVKELYIHDRECTVDLRNLPPGAYVMRTSSGCARIIIYQ